MSQFSDIRAQMVKLEEYERELHLKQLQINNLLSITQAINNNHSATELYAMYQGFLSFTMNIKKMALYFVEEGGWTCVCHNGLSADIVHADVTEVLGSYRRMTNVSQSDDPLLSHFDNIIPVFHKETPIAHVLVGGFDTKDDRYNKIQFITALTNVIAVAIENKRLFKQQVQQESLKKEMKLANTMQLSLVPSVMPKGKKYELDSVYIPHLSVGGDYYDFLQFDDNQRVILCIADIAGKGLAAALLMANFQANLHSLVRRRDDPATFIRLLNKAMFHITKGERFVTFFIAEFDQRTRKLRYVNAGHTPPYLYQDGKLSTLDLGCTFLGCFEPLPMPVVVGEIDIAEDALLVTFTDGITDTCDVQGVHFGDENLAEFIKNAGINGAKEFNQKLIKQLDDYRKDVNFTDDFTLVTLRMFA
jgi:phosphoserine phosphatase RsbU/P